MKWNLDAERDLWASICSPNRWFSADGVTVTTHPESLWYFVKYCWGTEWYFQKRPGEVRWLQERVHKPYVSWLQFHVLSWLKQKRSGSSEQYYIASLIPRAFGKTVCASKSAMLWTHLDNPDMSTLWFSATHSLSIDIADAVQKVVDGRDRDSWFTWLYGNWQAPDRKWKTNEAVHAYRESTNLSEPSFDTTGVDAGMTGYHHDIHCVDDPITKNKLREGGVYMKGVHDAVDAGYNALKENGLLMFVLTRYLRDDVAGRHFKNEGIATWDGMRCPDMTIFEKIDMGKGIWHVYFLQAENEQTGEAILPEVYNEKKIAIHKLRDPEDFACQYQNNPGAHDRAPLLESQIKDLYTNYADLNFIIPVLTATIHIDTAFKRKETVGQGDYSTIVVWLHDSRPNGLIYLDTDTLRDSNEWRVDQFHDELIKVCINLRKRGIPIRCLTDEREGFGKTDVYKKQIEAILQGAGFYFKIYQLPRQGTRKRGRIRTAAGYWAEGYVRVLLHKKEIRQPDGLIKLDWTIPKVVMKFFDQMLFIDTVDHDDLADAGADVFVEEPRLWSRPDYSVTRMLPDEGRVPVSPGDQNLKWFAKKLSDQEILNQLDVGETEYADAMGPGHGFNEYYDLPREPV